MKKHFANIISSVCDSNPNVYVFSGDLGYGVFDDFITNHPDKFYNTGISEQNMTLVASGMALEGKTVFTYSIANFPTARCFEQIRNNVCYHKANVKIVAIGAGFVYGSMGMTHHATEDLSFMRSLPEMTMFSPCDLFELEKCVEMALDINGPCYLRIGNLEINDVTNTKIEFGKPRLLKKNQKNTSKVAIITTGSICSQALEAYTMLDEIGVCCDVYSMPVIKPIDSKSMIDLAKGYEYLFTLEENNIMGGLGGAIAEIICEHRNMPPLCRIGLNDIFSSDVGNAAYLRNKYNIDAKAVFNIINSKISNL